MINDLFGTIKIALQYKSAISAAMDAVSENKSIPEVVKAFSEETDNKLDDKVAAEIGDHIADLADGLDSIAKFVNELAGLVEKHTPSLIEGTRILIKFLEENSGTIQNTLHKISESTGEYSDKLEAMATPEEGSK
tara:strand:+ start:2420 stop:2824 length:405 start_codon:yes stop_codon:yes gene_type:complete